MSRCYCLVVVAVAGLCAGSSQAGVIVLDFSAPVPGTIADVTGLGSGFTHRISGSGGAIPTNDPNMTLNTANGHLLLGSVRSDFNSNGFGRNLAAMDSPGLLLLGLGSQDFLIEAIFRNLQVNQLGDQMGLYAGSSVDLVVRGGVHEHNNGSIYQSFVGYSQNAIDGPPSFGGLNVLNAGDDSRFQLGRINGQWFFRWENLTQSGVSLTSPYFSLPLLDAQTSLYVGAFNNDSQNFQSQTAIIDSFIVRTGADVTATVPEPATLTLWSLVSLAGFGVDWYRKRRQNVA